MTRNRLTAAAEGWTGQAPAKPLEEFCAELNSRAYVRQMGVEYFVSQRMENGRLDKFIDRRNIHATKVWKPNERELHALRSVIARHASDDHLTQEQFNSLVRRGVIDRQMEAEMNAPRDRAA